jgi:putative hydrolase of the HAD superfamily
MIFLFDLDDTLLDDLAAKNHYMPKLYNHFNHLIKYDEQTFYKAWLEAVPKYHKKYTDGKMTFEEQRAARVKDAFGDWTLSNGVVKDVVRAFDQYFKEGWKPFRDTISTLECLADYRKGIVTNGSLKQQNEKINAIGIRKYFDCIIISEEVGISKPDEKIFRMACNQLTCSPSDCFFIGDSWETDVVGSYKAAMKPVWFNRHKKEIPLQLDGLFVIQELKDIKKIIEKAEIVK